MPELPEVETVVRSVRPRLTGRRIVSFESLWARNTRPAPREVAAGIVGQTVRRVSRRAKFIVLHFDAGCLLVHLGMSGRLEWDGQPNGDHRHVRATWHLDDGGRLLLCDARKFGRIVYTPDLEAALGKLGPEPLARGFTSDSLRLRLEGRRRQIKPVLLDQSVVAGLGNIYADESLFRAGLHPTLRCDRLRAAQLERLHAAIREVLREAIRHRGTSFDWVYAGGGMQERLMVYGRTGQPCPRCGTAIEASRLGGRSTHFCPRCQPRPRTDGKLRAYS